MCECLHNMKIMKRHFAESVKNLSQSIQFIMINEAGIPINNKNNQFSKYQIQ